MTKVIGVAEIGRELMRGAMVEFGKWFAIGLAVVFAANLALSWAGYGWDSTDDRAVGEHSGMRLRYDHLTGCQYLESGKGALTPRLASNGVPVCHGASRNDGEGK